MRSSVRCDVLKAVYVFVSKDDNGDMIFLDYSRKAEIMLGIWGTGGMKHAKAAKVERSKLRRARLILDYDARYNSYISIRSLRNPFPSCKSACTLNNILGMEAITFVLAKTIILYASARSEPF